MSQFYRDVTGSGTGVVETLTGNSGGAVGPTGGTINVVGEGGITTVGTPASSLLTITPYGVGTRNLFIGQSTGNITLSGTDNVGYGASALTAVTSGINNTIVGSLAGDAITSGTLNTAIGRAALGSLTTTNGNVAIGSTALTSIVTGVSNIAVGAGAGNALTGSDSSNIIIGNNGTVGDNNTIRLGTTGALTGQQNKCYLAGTLGVSTSTPQPVTIDTSTEQLGSSYNIYAARPIVTQADSATFALTDAYTWQKCTKATAMTLTVPANATVAFATGTEIEIYQQGAGQVTIAAAGGVTINSAFGALKIANQYSGAILKKTATNTWELWGNLTA